MVKWRDKLSGNIILLPEEETSAMLVHPAYERVEDGLQKERQETTQKVKRTSTRKR